MTEPKPQTEVTEGSRETLSVLELDRTPRSQKIAMERAYFDGAHEVRFTERTFRPKHGADIDEVRAFVDSLVIERREPPALPAAPTHVPVHVPARIPEHYRGPLERVIPGALVSVETVHRVGTGTVVDVAWESRDEGERRGLFVIEDDVARPYTDVAARIDELPPPKTEAPSSAPNAPPPASAPVAAPPKKKRFGFGKQKDPAPPAPPPAVSPAEEQPKKRFFGSRKR